MTMMMKNMNLSIGNAEPCAIMCEHKIERFVVQEDRLEKLAAEMILTYEDFYKTSNNKIPCKQ